MDNQNPSTPQAPAPEGAPAPVEGGEQKKSPLKVIIAIVVVVIVIAVIVWLVI